MFETCEFGACGAGPSSFQNPVALAPPVITCAFTEPCGAIALGVGAVIALAKITEVGMTVKTNGNAEAGAYPPGDPHEEYCAAQAAIDDSKCRLLAAPGARSRCFESSTNRYGACLGHKILPPLILW